ncbi:MAG TPA: hypothetical protein VJV78_42830 [Polyangiales bacterium]|nr:hypothetical protein [Polyangiales bacterium]
MGQLALEQLAADLTGPQQGVLWSAAISCMVASSRPLRCSMR